jgi:hypothetical protein
VTGNTVIDALRIEVATQAGNPALRARIHAELRPLVGTNWSQVPIVLITGHRRENFGDGIEQICQAIATLAESFPDHRFVYPVHLNPNVLEHVTRLLGGLSNVRLIAPHSRTCPTGSGYPKAYPRNPKNYSPRNTGDDQHQNSGKKEIAHADALMCATIKRLVQFSRKPLSCAGAIAASKTEAPGISAIRQ